MIGALGTALELSGTYELVVSDENLASVRRLIVVIFSAGYSPALEIRRETLDGRWVGTSKIFSEDIPMLGRALASTKAGEIGPAGVAGRGRTRVRFDVPRRGEIHVGICESDGTPRGAPSKIFGRELERLEEAHFVAAFARIERNGR